MGSAKFGAARTISQQAFDEMARENMEDLVMYPTEALQDAMETLTLQGVDLSDGCTIANDNEVEGVIGLLDELSNLCRVEGSGNAALATKNGGLELLAGSDTNKSVIVEKGGMDRLIKLSARFSDNLFVLQEVMSIICTLAWRSPDNAACAIEAGAGDIAIQAMQKFPEVHQLHKNSCLMIQNLVVRNPENRHDVFDAFCQLFTHARAHNLLDYVSPMFFVVDDLWVSDHITWLCDPLFSLYKTLLQSNGIEKIIRTAKGNHQSCKDAATDALRDLGLKKYNS